MLICHPGEICLLKLDDIDILLDRDLVHMETAFWCFYGMHGGEREKNLCLDVWKYNFGCLEVDLLRYVSCQTIAVA
jgi:hypothetical protein